MDKIYYSQLRKHIPDLEIYDWTKHNLPDTIDLFTSNGVAPVSQSVSGSTYTAVFEAQSADIEVGIEVD